MTTIGERLRWIREIYHGGDLAKMPERLGVSVGQWDAWERDREIPPIETMEEFAHRFRVTLSYVYEGDFSGINEALAYEIRRRYPKAAET